MGVHVVEHLDVGWISLYLDLVFAEQEGWSKIISVVVKGGGRLNLEEIDLACTVLGRLQLGRSEIGNHLLSIGSVDPPDAEMVLVDGGQFGCSFRFIGVHG